LDDRSSVFVNAGRPCVYIGVLMSAFFLSIICAALAWAIYQWLQREGRKHTRQRRSQGYELVHALNSYSAWLDFLRSEALLDKVQDQLAWPEALLRSREIIRQSFPALSAQLIELLDGDSRLMATMWQQEVRRLTQPGELFPSARDPDYQQLREHQEMLIQDMIARCRRLIGDSVQTWRRTDEEFDFSGSSGYASPVTRG
jgi:hypothetical protein